jgi:SAM-dependent methyltransferase
VEQEFFLDGNIAALYDASSPDMYDPALLGPTVDLLASLALGGSRTALELGIGTGRVALPLMERGVRLAGIDLSEPMPNELRKKPGADAIDITVGSFRTARLDRRFRLVFGIYNVFTTFTTQDEEVAAFLNAAVHVEPDGFLVAECWLPDLQRLPPGERLRAFDVSPTHLGFDEYQLAEQRCTSHHLLLDGDQVAARGSSHHRWLWPSELDLMARIAGMDRHERWATWTKEPFTSDSGNCISIYRKPSA